MTLVPYPSPLPDRVRYRQGAQFAGWRRQKEIYIYKLYRLKQFPGSVVPMRPICPVAKASLSAFTEGAGLQFRPSRR